MVTINGTGFVTGLFWQPLSSPRDYMAEVRGMAKAHGWDSVTIRKGRRIQAGFGSRAAGVSKGVYSLGAVLAKALGETWAGAFDLDDGRTYVCALKDNLIVPGFDCVVATGEAAAAKLAEAMAVVAPPEAQRYAPPALGLQGYRSIELSGLLDAKRLARDCQVRPVRIEVTKAEWTAIAAVAALVLAGLVGAQQYQAHKQRELVAERIRVDQENRAKAATLATTAAQEHAGARVPDAATTLPAPAPERSPHPWANMPAAADFASACEQATATVPLSVGGWVLEAATCDRSGVSIAYRRPKDGATVQDFAAGARGKFDGQPAFADEGGLALVGKGLGVPLSGDDRLRPVDAQLIDIVSYFQGIGITPAVSEAKPDETAAAPAAASSSAPLPGWRRFSLSYEAGVSPAAHFAALRATPGVRLTEIKLTLKTEEPSLKWNVKGEIYASR